MDDIRGLTVIYGDLAYRCTEIEPLADRVTWVASCTACGAEFTQQTEGEALKLGEMKRRCDGCIGRSLT